MIKQWLSKLSIGWWVTFLTISFIVLYPKLPLWQPIPGYIVRVRLEDLVVALVVAWSGYRFLKKPKLRAQVLQSLPKFFTASIGLVLIAGLSSALFNILVGNSIPLAANHVAKTILHWLRYLEYFSLLAIVMINVRTMFERKMMLGGLLLVACLAGAYGAGQKYLGWPVYSTMNYWFSQGVALRLVSDAARIPSTFAGHYDFGIFLSLILSIAYTWWLYLKQRSHAWWLLLLIQAWLIWSLIASGLRVAFGSFVLVTTLLSIAKMAQTKKYLKSSINLVIIGFVSLILLLTSGQNLQVLLLQSTRFLGIPPITNQTSPIVEQYQLPEPINPDIISDFETVDPQLAVLSDCARSGEISLCIRLERLWPQALASFSQNPILGTGYGTINKNDPNHLSEADAADNIYLRIAGETGLFGLLAWLSVFAIILQQALIKVKSTQKFESQTGLTMIGSIATLVITGLLFDVLAASKIAFVWWAIVGVCLPTSSAAPTTSTTTSTRKTS